MLVAWWVVTTGLHATFGRQHGIDLCRRWIVSTTVDRHAPSVGTLIQARMALEHPSSFVISDQHMSIYVCVPTSRDVHRIDAVVWHGAVDFRPVRDWHAVHFPEHSLTVGALGPEELDAWTK